MQSPGHQVKGTARGAQALDGAVEPPRVPAAAVAVDPAVGEEAPVEVVLQHQPEAPRDGLLLGREVRAERGGER